MTIKGLCRLHSQPATLSTMATSTVGLPRAPPDATPRHTWTVNGAGCDFTVDAKYTPGKLLGKGSYGVVASAYDEEKKRKVAIKCVPKVFDDEVDALRVLREIKLLRRLNHPNIIKLEDIVQPISEHGFASLHIVMEYMESDLHKIIHSKPKQLTIDHVRFILAQLLSGISHLKKAHVVHRDLVQPRLHVPPRLDPCLTSVNVVETVQHPGELGVRDPSLRPGPGPGPARRKGPRRPVDGIRGDPVVPRARGPLLPAL